MKQERPNNILWKLFRISAEKVRIPRKTDRRNREFVQNIMREK